MLRRLLTTLEFYHGRGIRGNKETSIQGGQGRRREQGLGDVGQVFER